ncbi:hypothetical protein [Actinophytocola sp. NPDC049390]|uniref:hypothetical protein n=1 Tax=Actinophytocola sp. NPDC049390 TaxID=3363894 RepID=UPI0037ABEA88
MPPPTEDTVRPPSTIHLACAAHPEVTSYGWTDAYNHQLDVHGGDETTAWNLVT